MENQSIVIYTDEQGQVALDVSLQNETLWLTQSQMSVLFGTTTDNISLHLQNIHKDGELEERPTTEDFSVVRAEGKRNVKRTIKHYNLDAVISVGYRVNSTRATKFRQWATKILKDYLIKGYAVNQKRLDEKSLNELTATIELVHKDKLSYCNKRLRRIVAFKNLTYIIQPMIERLEVSSVIMLNPLRCIIYIHRGVAPFVKSEAL